MALHWQLLSLLIKIIFQENNTIQPGTNQDELLNASDHNVPKYQSQMAQQRDYTPLLTAVKATSLRLRMMLQVFISLDTTEAE